MTGKGDKAELEQLLSSYIDGECPQAERDRVQEALQHDPELRALYTQLLRTIEAVGAMPSEGAPRHVRERILSKLERRALLGVTSVAAAPPLRQEPSRSRPTAWLGLLAAAMLVAGVGATWWIRTYQEKAPSQLAMAPAQPPRDSRIVVRETAPQEASERTRGSAGLDRGTDEAGRQYRSKVAAPAQLPPSPLAQASPPAAGALPSPPPQVVQPAVAQPETPLMADRAVHDVSRSEPPAQPTLDHALTMRERDSATVGGKPEALRPLGRVATERIAAAPSAKVAPPPEARNVQPAPGGPGEASRLAGEGGRFGQAAPLGALAAAARDKDTSDLPANQVLPVATTLASAAKGQPAAAPMAGLPLSAVAQASPAKSVGTYGIAGQLRDASGPSVTQLRVSVRDFGQQVAVTGGIIRSDVAWRGGQVLPQADASLILAAVPTGQQPPLVGRIERTAGVLQVQSHVLPANDPLAGQALSLAAGAWLQASWRFAESALWEPWPGLDVRSNYDFREGPVSVSPHEYSPLQEYTPLVIVLQPVAPAASEPSSQ